MQIRSSINFEKFFSFLPKVEFYWGTKSKRFIGNEQIFFDTFIDMCSWSKWPMYITVFFMQKKQFIAIFFFLLQAQAAEETSPDIGNGDGSVAPWVGFMLSLLLFHIFVVTFCRVEVDLPVSFKWIICVFTFFTEFICSPSFFPLSFNFLFHVL